MQQDDPFETKIAMSHLKNENFFCLLIPDVDAVCVLSDVEACFKTSAKFFGLLKLNYELSLFNIVV